VRSNRITRAILGHLHPGRQPLRRSRRVKDCGAGANPPSSRRAAPRSRIHFGGAAGGSGGRDGSAPQLKTGRAAEPNSLRRSGGGVWGVRRKHLTVETRTAPRSR
jgi:hypothetical protein